MKRTAFSLAILLATTCMARAEPMLPAFDPANFDPTAAIDNRYFPLLPDFSRMLAATGTNAAGETVDERVEMVFGGPGPVLSGVQTTTMIDRAFEDGVLVEETRDYYAQDREGNVWYMGEDVLNFLFDDEGRLTGTNAHSSWLAGVHDALPGFQMPADPQAGFAYFQEHAPADEAMDQAEIMGFAEKISVPAGDYEKVVMVYETSPIDPLLQEIKYYAPGVGAIRADENIDANKENPALILVLTGAAPVQ